VCDIERAEAKNSSLRKEKQLDNGHLRDPFILHVVKTCLILPMGGFYERREKKKKENRRKERKCNFQKSFYKYVVGAELMNISCMTQTERNFLKIVGAFV
jgi:hypothetical protein